MRSGSSSRRTSRMIPNDLPPWAAVYQQVRRWIKAGVSEEIVHELQEILRIAAGPEANPTAVVIDGRTLHVTPADKHDRSQVRRTAKAMQKPTGRNVTLASVDQGDTGEQARDDAEDSGIVLHVARLSDAKRGLVLLPKAAAGLHFAVFACIMLARFFATSA